MFIRKKPYSDEHTEGSPDNAESSVRRAGPRDPLGEQNARPLKPIFPTFKKGIRKVYNSAAKIFTGSKVKCVNKDRPEIYGKKFKQCPIPKAERIIENRPWYCNWCKLKDDVDPI